MLAGFLGSLQCRGVFVIRSYLYIWVTVHAVDNQVMHIVGRLQQQSKAVGIA